MQSVLRYKNGGRLLEIGPWMGIFSSNAKDAGFEVTTIEMNRECVDFLNNVVNITAIQSNDPAATMGAMDENFDVIVLWHSLEHLNKPWLVLQKAAERLSPGGILLIAVPNIESYDFSVLKECWYHLDAPRHLRFYTAQWLEKICSTNGLNMLEMKTNDQLSKILSKDAWYVRAASIVRVKYLTGILSRLLRIFAMKRSKGNNSGITAIFSK